MKIAICGSMAFLNEMKQAAAELAALGHEVILPRSAELGHGKTFTDALKAQSPQEYSALKTMRVKEHFDKVKAGDAILVLNYDKLGKLAYIGPNTFLEMGVAFHENKKIFLLNSPSPLDPNLEEIEALEPVVLDGNIAKIR